jgi:hypothetical protein
MAAFDILKRRSIPDDLLDGLVIREACDRASAWELKFYVTILPKTAETMLVSILVESKRWDCLPALVREGVSEENLYRIAENVSDHQFEDTLDRCPRQHFPKLIPVLARTQKWCSMRSLFHKIVVSSLKLWAASDKDRREEDVFLPLMNKGVHFDASQFINHKCSSEDGPKKVSCELPWTVELSEMLYRTLMRTLFMTLRSDVDCALGISDEADLATSEIYREIKSCIQECLSVLKPKTSEGSTSKRKCVSIFDKVSAVVVVKIIIIIIIIIIKDTCIALILM